METGHRVNILTAPFTHQGIRYGALAGDVVFVGAVTGVPAYAAKVIYADYWKKRR
jgi:hypothetical protein